MVGSKPGARVMQAPAAQVSDAPAREERPVLFQHYFKSGPRTYAAQVKQASNGRPFLVLTEGRRDAQTDEVHKSRIMVFSDDLAAFFHLLQETATFLRPLRTGKSALPPAQASQAAGDPASQVTTRPANPSPRAATTPTPATRSGTSPQRGAFQPSGGKSVRATRPASADAAPRNVATPRGNGRPAKAPYKGASVAAQPPKPRRR